MHWRKYYYSGTGKQIYRPKLWKIEETLFDQWLLWKYLCGGTGRKWWKSGDYPLEVFWVNVPSVALLPPHSVFSTFRHMATTHSRPTWVCFTFPPLCSSCTLRSRAKARVGHWGRQVDLQRAGAGQLTELWDVGEGWHHHFSTIIVFHLRGITHQSLHCSILFGPCLEWKMYNCTWVDGQLQNYQFPATGNDLDTG